MPFLAKSRRAWLVDLIDFFFSLLSPWTRLGIYFAPLLPVVLLGQLVIIFYAKKVSCQDFHLQMLFLDHIVVIRGGGKPDQQQGMSSDQ